MKKTPFVDKNSGDYNLKYNIQNLTEDFFLPVRGGDSGTAIENLAGLEYAAVEDIDLFFRLFCSWRNYCKRCTYVYSKIQLQNHLVLCQS